METGKRGRRRPQAGGSSGSSRSGGARPRPDGEEDNSRKSQMDGRGVRLARGATGEEGSAVKPRSRRGGRCRAKAKERKLVVKDSGLKELLLHLSMLVSQLAQRSRAMWGIATRTALLEEKSPAAKATQAESQDFSQVANNISAEVSKLKGKSTAAKDSDAAAPREHDAEAEKVMRQLRSLGPPATAVLCAMIEAPSKEKIGKRLKYVTTALMAEMQDGPPAFVRLCRLESCKQTDTLKVVVALDRVDLEMQVMEAFRSSGAVSTVGVAPSGYLEGEISAWIDVLKVWRRQRR